MTRLQCSECGKRYTYEVDDFCPRCGAYNQPPKAGGAVVRRDGVSEVNHTGSFTHREIHREKAQRRWLRLDHPEKTSARPAKTIQAPLAGAGQQKTKQQKTPLATVITVVVWLIILVQILAVFFD